ncbi:MAG TPA: BlaI/MecI/CopY family transcriptional regulator [Candidatus Coprenecus pullistercoris]|nr:BlaI/MecI/CopY family transcriptional regulator [Candidatus Coprenecus pullistercoris]
MAKIIKDGRQELTRAELEIMQVIWKKGKVLVHGILDEMPEPKPAYNTVSTIVRILESKGFVSHKAYGRTYEYFPLVGKEEYTGAYMRTVLDNFFDGSVSRMVNFFSSRQSITTEETDEILRILKSGK